MKWVGADCAGGKTINAWWCPDCGNNVIEAATETGPYIVDQGPPHNEG
jgi:hypothetical protein